LKRLFEALQREGIIQIKMEAVCLDSTTVKVHPDAAGALKKPGNKAKIAGRTHHKNSYGASDCSVVAFFFRRATPTTRRRVSFYWME
jgi:hypothetical protein